MKKSDDINKIINTVAIWALLFGLIASGIYCYIIGKEEGAIILGIASVLIVFNMEV